MNWRGALALLAAAELCGCASLPAGSDGLGLDQRRALLDSIGAWEMRGRLTVDTGDGAFQGSFISRSPRPHVPVAPANANPAPKKAARARNHGLTRSPRPTPAPGSASARRPRG